MRAFLGFDSEGTHNLPHAQANDGRYLVGPHVGCDLTRFTNLVQRSQITGDTDHEIELLTEAVGTTPWATNGPTPKASSSTPKR